MKKKYMWLVYDGRVAFGDTSDAMVLDTCTSESEARKVVNSGDYGTDCVYYQYTKDGSALVDEQGPFFGKNGG